MRSGFFGVCVTERAAGAPSTWVCSKDAARLAGMEGVKGDPLNLVAVASGYRTETVFAGLLYVFPLSFDLFR